VGEHWSKETLLVPHEAFRWIDENLKDAIQHYKGESWQTKLLFDYLENYYIHCVHHHHVAEEKIYNPIIVKKIGEFEGLNTIGPDHKKICAILDDLPSFRNPCTNKDPDAIKMFKATLLELLNLLNKHFEEEERFYPPAVFKAFPEESEHDVIVNKIIEDLGLEGNKKYLPVIMYAMYRWAGPDYVDDFISKLPAPVVFLLNYFWIPDFEKNQLGPLSLLASNSPPHDNDDLALPCAGCF